MFSNYDLSPTLTIDEIQNGNIYNENIESLANRIDFAWATYKNNTHPEALRLQALKFLTDTFSISPDYNSTDDLLAYLMKKREKYKRTNPEYVPALSPFYPILFYASRCVPEKTKAHGEPDSLDVKLAIQSGEILDVNDLDKKEDNYGYNPMLKPEGRWQYRVQIVHGMFKRNGEICDTSYMVSHHKLGYASFTLNTNGELSLFNHLAEESTLTHSSINAGAPVICAGELKIKDGVLESVTTYSGHYDPTIANVYNLLKFFVKNGIEITDQIKILSHNDISSELEGVTTTEMISSSDFVLGYETPANQIYCAMGKGMQNDLDHVLTDLNESINLWSRDNDASPSTKERLKLIKEFSDVLVQFKANIDTHIFLSPPIFKYKMHELKELISIHEKKNLALSEKYQDKNHYLANCFTHFRMQTIKAKHIDYNILKDPDRYAKMKQTF